MGCGRSPHVAMIVLAAIFIAAAGCPKQTAAPGCRHTRWQQTPPKATAPDSAKAPPAPVAQPPEPPPPATKPATTRPVQTQPASTYDSKPPYPVQLHVRNPDEQQPGWLRILKLSDTSRLATASGTFPEQNLISVDTQNVDRCRSTSGTSRCRTQDHRPADRPAGHPDRSKRRDFITLERSPAGVWKVVRPAGAE